MTTLFSTCQHLEITATKKGEFTLDVESELTKKLYTSGWTKAFPNIELSNNLKQMYSDDSFLYKNLI